MLQNAERGRPQGNAEGSGCVYGEWWGGGVCSITSALMTSPEFKVGRATDSEEEERREEQRAGSSPDAQTVRASAEIK